MNKEITLIPTDTERQNFKKQNSKKMVKKILIISVILINMSSFGFDIRAQGQDTIKCDKYFSSLEEEKGQLKMQLWSRAPSVKEGNVPILNELCEMLLNNSYESLFATLIIDENGNPICAKIYSEIDNDAFKNKIMYLLYKIKFEPAFAYKEPVRSYYPLILNTKRCDMYNFADTNKKRNKKKWLFR